MNKRVRSTKISDLFISVLALTLFSLISFSSAFAAEDSVCAEVQIEISQELTLERQAFDAHMRINNGLSNISLEDVDVDVRFSDEEGNSILASSDPDNTDALFYIRIDSMENIDDVEGNGSVGPSTTADIHWLIIPATGASNGVSTGTLYYVGAELTYTIGGEENVTEVSPDYIFVKPMPELTLDYFLPSEVFGDDAFTPGVTESPIPFPLGLRIKNNGSGTAANMKIDSAQPKIVENDQGLLIGFEIIGSLVNGSTSSNDLLVDFGNIDPGESSTAQWTMTCTLSGQFVEFTAQYSHADELGGELTSLIEDIDTHTLVKDVLVDLNGRDAIDDFLALDGSVYRIYESNGVDTEVSDQSSSSSLDGSGYSYTLSTSPNPGFAFIKISDPLAGQKVLKEVVRSDGKLIKADNAWLSKTRDGQDWDYWLNIFDAATTGSYSILFQEADDENQPPELQSVPDQSVIEENQISFIVSASDPEGMPLSLSASPLPALSTFTDQGDGSGVFNWIPSIGQAGIYEITFRVSDGELEDFQKARLTIMGADDTDFDTMSDQWEMDNFGTLDRDGTGDFDGDGISDLDEFLAGTDPLVPNTAPSVPVIISPADKGEVTEFNPVLTIENSHDPDGDQVSYIFELFADKEITVLLDSVEIMEGVDITSWPLQSDLSDNTMYYWRVRAYDGFGYSLWRYGEFFVNSENDAPGEIKICDPANGALVSPTPTLSVFTVEDVDKDNLSYRFEVYEDAGMTLLIASSPEISEKIFKEGPIAGGAAPFEIDQRVVFNIPWTVETSLSDNTTYYWKAVVTDEHGESIESPVSIFQVDTSYPDPEIPYIGLRTISQETDIFAYFWDATAEYNYYFEIDKVKTFDSEALQTSGPIAAIDGQTEVLWNVTGLEDNTLYYCRVKSSNENKESNWSIGYFHVNTINEPLNVPTIRNPGHESWVDTPVPELIINKTLDPDNEYFLEYEFELYDDSALTNLVQQTIIYPHETTGNSFICLVENNLQDLKNYYWRARARDYLGDFSEWTEVSEFFYRDDGEDDPPEISILEPLWVSGGGISIMWEDSDIDSNATISLFYDTDNSGEDGNLIAEGILEDPEIWDDFYYWYAKGMEGFTDGIYYIYAVISDSTSSYTYYTNEAIYIDTTPPNVTVAPAGGFYTEQQTVSLSADETADIYYSLDGSYPSSYSGILYESPFEIASNTTIKVQAQDQYNNYSDLITETYTFTVSIPDLIGMSQSSAETTLSQSGLIIGIITSDYSFDIPTGHVISHNPPAGGTYDVNTPVDLVISLGCPVEAVPNLVGLSEGDASAFLSGSTLTMDINYQVTGDPKGFVISQGIPADEMICQGSSIPVVISANNPPVADAGQDLSNADFGDIFLDGSGSSDIDGDTLSYSWSIISLPTGSIASVSDPSLVNPSIDIDMEGSYVLELVVNDGTVNSVYNRVIISTHDNLPPIANAGADQSTSLFKTVCLDGSVSADPDNDAISFNWSIISRPEGSNAELDDSMSVGPCFVPDKKGDYRIQLIVDDGEFDSEPDSVFIRVTGLELHDEYNILAAGYYHSVGLKPDGTLMTAGHNSAGQLEVKDWTDIIEVAAGYYHTVGLRTDGTVLATGKNDDGQIDVNEWTDIVHIAAGAYYTVGIKSDGTALATGRNDYGQCDVTEWTDIIQVSAGYIHTVGVRSDGTVIHAGYTGYGLEDVTNWSDIVMLAAGTHHTVGIRSDATVLAAGNNYQGQGNVTDWSAVVWVSAGHKYTIAIRQDGTLVAAGLNNYGQSNVDDWQDMVRVRAGYGHTLGLGKDGIAKATGWNYYYQCNVDTWNDLASITAGGYKSIGMKSDGSKIPVGNYDYGQLNILDWSDVVAIEADFYHTLGLKYDGTVEATGRNDYGQCDVDSWLDISKITAGEFHSIGVKTDGTVVATGKNDSGQCDVETWTNIRDVATGKQHTIGLRNDGTTITAGTDYYGLKDANVWTDIIEIAAGRYHSIGLKADGTVLAVGNNTYGPCDVSGWTDIVRIKAGKYHTLGIKSDGSVVAAGLNDNGQLEVSEWNNIIDIAAGKNHSLGLTGEGQVKSTGYNAYGQSRTDYWRLTPIISDIPARSVREGETAGPVPFTIHDFKTPSSELILSAISDNPALVPDENIDISGSDQNRTITIVPVEEETGMARITITLTNSESASAKETFILTVGSGNGYPMIWGTPSASIFEGDSYFFMPKFFDQDLGDDLVLDVANKPSWMAFFSDTGLLTGTPGQDDSGIINNITISATDESSLVYSLPPFDLTVLDISQAPRADAGINQDVAIGATVNLDGSESSVPGGGTISYSWNLISVPRWSTAAFDDPTISNPSFIPNKAGQYVIELVVDDGENKSQPDTVVITAQ